MDRKIDCFIIGAQKSGTTALYDYLARHPEIYMPQIKENHFFVRDEFYEQGDDYLDAVYRDARGQKLWGGADVDLMYFTDAADRIIAYNPAMKLVAVLRHPIDRAYSAYWFARRNGTEMCRTFEQALRLEPERRFGSRRERVELTYLEHGHYAQQLRVYFDRFGRGRVHVVLSDDLRTARDRTLTVLFEWLGVGPNPLGLEQAATLKNVAALPYSAGLHRWLRTSDSGVKRLGRRLVPARVRYALRRRVREPLMRWNLRPFQYPPMMPATRAQLRHYFRPHNADLAALLDRDLSSWDS